MSGPDVKKTKKASGVKQIENFGDFSVRRLKKASVFKCLFFKLNFEGPHHKKFKEVFIDSLSSLFQGEHTLRN